MNSMISDLMQPSEAGLKQTIRELNQKIAEAQEELDELQRGVKGTTILLTGEKVPEYKANHVVGPVTSHCPGKWVMVDMEKGSFYAWHPINKCWVTPPKKVAAFFKKVLRSLRG